MRSHFLTKRDKVMKRDCVLRCAREASPPPKRLASSMVSLNVGGKHFDTTQETLRKAAYFHLYLTGKNFTKQVPSFILHPLNPFSLPMSSQAR